MSVMIQIRNVPEELHRKLKARAAMAGMSLSDYLRRLAERDLEKPTLKEWLERVKSREPVSLDPSPTEIIRQERDSR